jgi:hypothetical protein
MTSDIADQQEINRLNAKVEALEGEVERLRVALEKIADSDNWPGHVASKALEGRGE